MSRIQKERSYHGRRHFPATQKGCHHLNLYRSLLPSNFWRSKITNGKGSDKCDLCKALWISLGRFTTESALPVQTLGHIQHTCEALSEIHTMAHHRCWCLEVFNHCAEQTLWNAARDSEMQCPLTRAEMIHRQQGISHEQIAEDRLGTKDQMELHFKCPLIHYREWSVYWSSNACPTSLVTTYWDLRAWQCTIRISTIGTLQGHATLGLGGTPTQLCLGSAVPQWGGVQRESRVL